MVEIFKSKKKESTTEIQCTKCGTWFKVPENPFVAKIPKVGVYTCPKCKNPVRVGGGSFFIGRQRSKKEEEKK